MRLESKAESLAGTLFGFVVLWLVLDRSASALGSFRGEAGLLVCGAVLLAAVPLEMFLSRSGTAQAIAALGLRLPARRALLWCSVLCAGLLCVYPLFAVLSGAELGLREDSALLMPGLFAQGGVAEELVFRGYLFRRVRAGRSFWRAALLAAVPFAAVHALLFLSLDFPVALASLLMSISLSFPLAWLFERGGGSVLPPAIVHAVVQGSIKLVEAGDHFSRLALVWIAVGSLAPWAFFLLRPEPVERARAQAPRS